MLEKQKARNRIKKFFSLIALFLTFLISNHAYAIGLNPDTVGQMGDQAGSFNDSAGYDAGAMPADIIASFIQAFLGLLGIIFIIIIILAGYNWLTAGGNEEKVEKAQKLIFRGIIGLIIIASAYIITGFVFKKLGGTINNNGNNGVNVNNG